jgi:hypothetical protein
MTVVYHPCERGAFDCQRVRVDDRAIVKFRIRTATSSLQTTEKCPSAQTNGRPHSLDSPVWMSMCNALVVALIRRATSTLLVLLSGVTSHEHINKQIVLRPRMNKFCCYSVCSMRVCSHSTDSEFNRRSRFVARCRLMQTTSCGLATLRTKRVAGYRLARSIDVKNNLNCHW